MKKIDMFVFGVNITCVIIVIGMLFLSLMTGSERLLNSMPIVDIVAGLIIFVRFIYDENYKIQYYIGFIICSKVFSKLMDLVIENFAVTIISLGIVLVVVGFVSAIFTGWMYQYFKEMSYKQRNDIEELK